MVNLFFHLDARLESWWSLGRSGKEFSFSLEFPKVNLGTISRSLKCTQHRALWNENQCMFVRAHSAVLIWWKFIQANIHTLRHRHTLVIVMGNICRPSCRPGAARLQGKQSRWNVTHFANHQMTSKLTPPKMHITQSISEFPTNALRFDTTSVVWLARQRPKISW